MLKKVAFVLALMLCVSVALALESGPSNTVGFVKIGIFPNTTTAFGLPFTFWNVVSGVPQYGTVSNKPSSIIGAQLTGGSGSTGDRCYRQAGSYAYRTTTAALWAGTLETASEMVVGRGYWIWEKHGVDPGNMVLAGQVDTSTFGPIAISPNTTTPLSFRDARVKNRANLNLLTSGFTGGTGSTSDRLYEQGGAYCYYLTGTSVWGGALVNVTPGKAYWVWEKHGNSWNYNYGPGTVSRPPDRPGDDNSIDRISRPNRPSGAAR